MGREIRRVPIGWEHPRQECRHSPWAGGCDEAKRNGGKCYQPVYDRDFETAATDWLKENAAWENGEDSSKAGQEAETGERVFYWEWGGSPPDREYYRPKWTDEECTAYQMYETVSEGTPVSPVFETPEGLIDYLVENGDFWDQYRGEGGWTRENATAFVKAGFAMSMVAIPTADGYVTKMPRDGQL